ncbi:hypothetical protein MNV49_000694 [Pseudohyphozyma bogoriensis]|nr:hypothetical protein MNV49_000694 [Pseudohyphozyma bogoriensis]
MAQPEPEEELPIPNPKWFDQYPVPKAKVGRVSVEEVKTLLEKREEGGAGQEFLIVDSRRTDFETGFIRTAINLPAHSFYPLLPSILPILLRYSLLIFHCQNSINRGPRVAGWVQDALDARGVKEEECRVVVMRGGFAGWWETFGEEEEWTVSI